MPPPLKTPPKVLLLALGNELLSDDSVGLRVAAALRERFSAQPNLTVTESHEMGLSLLDLIVGFEDLVLLDAIQTGQAAPGFVHELDGDDLKALPAVSPHFLGVGEVLALGRKLGMQVPARVEILAIEVQDPFTLATELTPALAIALPQIIERVALAVTQVMCFDSKSPS